MTAEERLAALGFTLPEVPAPLGGYVPAVLDGSIVWTSGMLPLVDGSLLAVGVVGEDPGDVPMELARECARVAALNALAAIAEAMGGLGRIARIVRVVGYVASSPGFAAQPAVVNGASDFLVDVFGEAGRHVRSAVGVSVLPLHAPVEIEVVARVS